MEVLNKIYTHVSSSVSSTVSQISSVLPGNPVTREFEATSHIASAGPGLLWRIYSGTKKSTKQEASIFVFEKRQIDSYNKMDREIILDSIRRGVTQLTKIRHPQILTVQHPLEESRESLAFAAEPVFVSLANVLGQTFNMPQPTNLVGFKLHDIEIKYGLLQLSEGLAFLHNDVKLIHKNISPESIIINKQGAWKIFGFDFCVLNANPAINPPHFPFEPYSITVPVVAQPNLGFLPPEIVLGSRQNTAVDMFSFGMVIYALYTKRTDALHFVRDLDHFKARMSELNHIPRVRLIDVPEGLIETLKRMLNIAPDLRLDAHQFVKIPHFDDVGVKTLTYLDSLLQWDNLQKSQFFKGLPEALKSLPLRVRIQRVLPSLVRELTQPAMVPFILPSLFDIAQECTYREYVEHILPHIKPVMRLMDPIQILLIMLQNMETLLRLTPPEDVQQHVLPMLYRGLDSEIPQVHEMCLSVLPTFAGLLDHTNVKHSLLPRIKKLCLSTSSLSVRVNCLLCVGRLLEHLDKWIVLDEILPFLPQIPSREPAVLMGILGIYKLALNHKKLGISKEVVATRILPFLIPLCIENGLTLAQFNSLVAVVKQMFQLVETEHRSKLEQLNTVQEQQKVLESTIPVVNASKPLDLEQMFFGLGLDNYITVKSPIKDKQPNTSQSNFQPQLLEPQPTPPMNNPQPKDLSLNLFDNIPKPINPPPAFSNWSNTNSNPNPWSSTKQFPTQKKSIESPNWSAFDNLLPPPPNRIPMNQMVAPDRPLLQPHSNNGTNTNNKTNGNTLSKEEIMDLLS